MSTLDETLVLIPAYNEALNLEALLQELDAELPGVARCVIDDGSTDRTAEIAREKGERCLRLPCHVGVGGAMQTGFRYAHENGFTYAVRLDGDGQHPPAACARLAERVAQGDVDMAVASRFLGQRGYTAPPLRRFGNALLARILSWICGRPITDPTSGFQAVNRSVMYYFAHRYPDGYPEPESLTMLCRQGYRVCEVAVPFRPPRDGASSIRRWGSVFYVFKLTACLLADRCREVAAPFVRERVERVS